MDYRSFCCLQRRDEPSADGHEMRAWTIVVLGLLRRTLCRKNERKAEAMVIVICLMGWGYVVKEMRAQPMCRNTVFVGGGFNVVKIR